MFAVVSKAFSLDTSLDDLAVVNLRRQLLSLLIHLIHCGLVGPVFKMVKENLPRMDHALIRSFVLPLVHSTGTVLPSKPS